MGRGDFSPIASAISPSVHWRIGSNIKNPFRLTGIYSKAEWHEAVNVGLRSKLKDGKMEMKIKGVDIIEEKNLVILELEGQAEQVNGKAYENLYAWFLVFGGEKDEEIVEIREYLDTALVEEVWTGN